ncbi:hypothetical protein G4B88_004882 [Cannabis sativa]|uniref:Uncharacterized protein n=1 Tax=Cannabis sativa TaxID=3483 RepID=A0A7J6FXX4_CANSA|nr:hypothetical protein G4B88_004882 [Cannabis sativa]
MDDQPIGAGDMTERSFDITADSSAVEVARMRQRNNNHGNSRKPKFGISKIPIFFQIERRKKSTTIQRID